MRHNPREKDGPGATGSGRSSTRLSLPRRAGGWLLGKCIRGNLLLCFLQAILAGTQCTAAGVVNTPYFPTGKYEVPPILTVAYPRRDKRLELGEIERFGENRAAELTQHVLSFGDLGGAGIARHEYDLRREVGSVLVDPVLELEATLVAEPQIDERAIDRIGLEKAERARDGACGVNDVPAPREPGDDRAPNCFFVVDVKDGCQQEEGLGIRG